MYVSVTDPPPTNTGSFHFPTRLMISFVLILATLFLVLVLTLLRRANVPIEFQVSPEPVTMSPQYVKCPQVNCPTPEPAINHAILSDPLLQYQVYLHKVYDRYIYPKYSKPSEFLAVNRPERPINLVLIHKEKKIDTSRNIEIQFDFHEKEDEIPGKKSIKIEEIGSVFNVTAHFVHIEGAAGIGKSTLCWQLCRLWLEGKLQRKWDLVVLVELRDKDTRKATSVYDLLYHPDDSVRQSIAREIHKREGEGLMIILDGYDELSHDQRCEFSVIQQILESNRVLEKATIVVTSRPLATNGLPAKFKQDLDQHIEIAGFNETDIQTYITLACKDNIKMLKDLRFYVSNGPFILSVMSNPLHCTIVTELYIQYWLGGQKLFAPKTLTELYTALVLYVLRRSLPLNQSSKIVKLTDLPTPVYDNLMLLAELAATGLETEQYMFNNVTCDTLDLMVSVRQLYDVRPKEAEYMFLHLTLQEYLSALYWYHQPQQQQTDIIHSLLKNTLIAWIYGCDQDISSEFEEIQHWPHLLFLAGLTKLNSISLELISDSIYVIGPICQLLFESQSPQKVSEVVGHYRWIDEVDTYSVTSQFDWFVIGYCIATSNTNSSWNIELESLHNLQLLSDGLRYSKKYLNLDWSGLEIDMKIPYISDRPAEYSMHFSNLYPYTKAISHLSLGGYMHTNKCCFHVLNTFLTTAHI